MMSTMEMLAARVAVIGAGTMGRSLAGGMVRSGLIDPARLTLTDRHEATMRALANELGAAMADTLGDACAGADVVLLCVKPNDVRVVLDDLVRHHALQRGTLVISIAAGVRIAAIEQVIGEETPVVRAMPNTPCVIAKGMTVVSRGTHATDAHLHIAERIFTTLGRCLVLDEKHLDAVTALSASGPAFLYVVLEALADGGVMCGLPRDVATLLAAQMTLGTAEMVLTTGRHPAALKDDVTTPAGCTIAGLLALEDGRIRSVMARAIESTARVASGLGK